MSEIPYFVRYKDVTTLDSTDSLYLDDATISRKYLMQASLSFSSGTGDVCQFGFYDSKLGAVRTPSKTKATANSAGRAENIHMACVVAHSQGDYLEVHCSNTSSSVNITVSDLNFVITEIK